MRSAALVGLLLVAACAAPSAPPAASPVLTVTLDQSRDLENRHLLAVRVTNESGEPVDVVRLQLRSDAWSSVSPTVREERLAPGQRLAFPVAYGAADCAVRDGTRLVVGYRRGGALHETQIPVPAADPLLPRLHRRECDLAALARTAEVSFAPGWTRRGDSAFGTLVLHRRHGNAPVTVSAVDGSVIFTLREVGILPVVLRDQDVLVPVEALPTRCDPHALAESKRTFVFAIATSVGDGPALIVPVQPRPEDLPGLQQLLLDVCL